MIKKLVAIILLLCSSCFARKYNSTFDLTENPLSEGGVWVGGGTVGLDWTDMQSASGKAYGTESSSSVVDDDSTAILAGSWGPDQIVTGTIVQVGTPANEIEVRCRTNIAAHSITGYEITFGQTYIQIVSWNGSLGNFDPPLAQNLSVTRANGDVFKVTCVGTTITAYQNGVQRVQYTSATQWTSGSPGIGFFNAGGGDPTQSDIAFTDISVTDGIAPTPDGITWRDILDTVFSYFAS